MSEQPELPESPDLTEANDLPSCVHRVDLEGRTVWLVGTAHVSNQSVADVRQTLDAVRPDSTCIELCEPRYTNMMNREAWRQLDVFQVLRQGKATLLFASLLMTSFQKRIGEKLGVEPGAEMRAAIDWAKDHGSELVLADRDIQTTLKRTWAGLGFWTRIKMAVQMIGGVLIPEEIDEETIEKIKEEAELSGILDEMAREFPKVKGTLIDERDLYLAEKIRRAPGQTIVAVVGAGHVPGIRKAIGDDHDLAPLEVIPKPGILVGVLKWGIPVAILALLAWGFYTGGAARSAESVGIWFAINGICSALGAAIALGHPLTVLAALIAAPFTSLNPMIAAGWVAGLVQAWLRRPTVDDLERLPEDILTVKGFWKNPVSRILLVVVLANLGSTVGTFVAGSWIAARTF
ncbi:MAG: TraB/GumN family protein [Thermoanaerobaculia bacterium]|nr:TraB/GumN family protein [Thermoanaerobaculia bacterium]